MMFDSVATRKFSLKPWSAVFIDTVDRDHAISSNDAFNCVSRPASHFSMAFKFTFPLG